jgi:hypothetical protein
MSSRPKTLKSETSYKRNSMIKRPTITTFWARPRTRWPRITKELEKLLLIITKKKELNLTLKKKTLDKISPAKWKATDNNISESTRVLEPDSLPKWKLWDLREIANSEICPTNMRILDRELEMRLQVTKQLSMI